MASPIVDARPEAIYGAQTMPERSHTGDLAHRLGIPVWTHAGDVQHVIDETIKHLGRIHVLVNKARDAWLGHTVTPQ
jgi:hypothetical protein